MTYVHTASGEQQFTSERDALMFVAGYSNTLDATVEIRVYAEPGNEIHIFLTMVYPEA